MNIIISHPIALKLHKYFTDFDERMTRSKFATVMLVLSVSLIAIYYFGSDFTKLQVISDDFNKHIANIATTENISIEQSLEKVSQDESVIMPIQEGFTSATPHLIWICLIMLLSIPAIIKRTNDSIFERSHCYPVIISYILTTIQYLTGLPLVIGPITGLIMSTLNVYTFIFVFIIAFMPTHEKQIDERTQ